MHLKIEGAVVTDAGKRRTGNEDNYYLFGNYKYDTNVNFKKERKTVLAEQMLAAVYDGMGGEEAGEVASLTAARFFIPCTLENIQKEAAYQTECANRAICEEIQRRGGGRMGTTAVMLYIDKGKAVCCNVGDSRCYFMREGILWQISVDHSEAGNMIRMGILDEEKARKSKSWHKLTQHLGIFPEEFMLEPHFGEEISMQEGDLFLLCSDGLTDMVPDGEIKEILNSTQDVADASERLVEAALENGGRDNVTAMVLRVCRAEKSIWQSITEKLREVPKKIWIILFILAVAAIIIA